MMPKAPVVLSTLTLLIGCDNLEDPLGGGTGNTPGVTPEEVPIYNRSACGTLPASNLPFSNARAAAVPFALQQLVGGRIDPASMTNREHYWKLRLPRGAYHLVVDSNRSAGNSSNIGLRIVRLDQSGAEMEQIARGNEISRSYRDAGFFKVASEGEVQFKVTGSFEMEDYLLGVFANDHAVPSPRFVSCPTLTPLTVGQGHSFVLGAEGSDNEEQWFSLPLELGDYRFFAEAVQADGAATNLIYSLYLLDQFGQDARAARVLRVNEIDTSFAVQGMRSVGEPTPYWVRLRNGNKPLNLTLTVSPL